MSLLKAIIIDDESAARSFLSALISEYIDHLEVIGTANNALEGIKLLKTTDPAIIFLDIEMPGGNGFDFLDAIDRKNYKIVFTTAYKDFAIDAFKYRADGYLLKPIDIDDLEDLMESLSKSIVKNHPAISHITFRTQESLEYIHPEEIVRAKSEGNYTTIYTTANKKIVISKNMKQIEEILNFPYFIKTHKSFLVNRNHIKRYLKPDGGCFEMSDGAQIPLSRRKKDEILKLLDISNGQTSS